MVNKVILIGNLGADPIVATAGSSKVAKISIATTEKYKDKNGERKESTEWHKVEMWGRLAEICEEYLKKGHKVYVEGKLKTDTYEKDGETKYVTKITAFNMSMLGGKEQSNATAPTGGTSQVDDDLPF